MAGVDEHLTSAYHPQSNGLVERFNQTLQRQLLKFVEGEQKQWDLYLDSILFSYRVSKQDSTKYSPFFLMYGRQARLPVEFNLKPEASKEDCDSSKDCKQHERSDCNLPEAERSDCNLPEAERSDCNLPEAEQSDCNLLEAEQSKEDCNRPEPSKEDLNEQDLLDKEVTLEDVDCTLTDDICDKQQQDLNFEECAAKMIIVRKKALENIKVAQKKQKQYYDAKHCSGNKEFKVGSLVLVRNSKKLSRKGSKLEPNWTGPYKICEVCSKGTFKLCHRDNKENKLASLYNISRLKLYRERKR